MTWRELKTAIENAEIHDDDEICAIECTHEPGDKTLHVMRLGRALKLTESRANEPGEYAGCAT